MHKTMDREQLILALEQGKVKTPCYIFNRDILLKHLESMKKMAQDTVSFCYAMKANPYVIAWLKNADIKVEVCSPGELELCRHYEILPQNIIFSGVNKTAENVARAFETGVGTITVESIKHFNLIKSYCEEHHCSADILLRLTSGAQFGMDRELLEKIVSKRAEYPYLTIEGIHFFSGTQKKKAEKIKEELSGLKELLDGLKEKYQYQAKILEYGAGLSVPYFEGENFDDYYGNLTQTIEMIGELSFSAHVVLELGRYIAASCGEYLTTVEDCKINDGHRYAIVDGGIHHLNYYGQNMAMRVPLIEKLGTWRQEEEKEEWCICGSLCTFADVLVRKAAFANLKEGDILRFQNAGAYSVTEAPFLFLSRRMPDIYEYSKGQYLKIRAGIEAYRLNCEKQSL